MTEDRKKMRERIAALLVLAENGMSPSQMAFILGVNRIALGKVLSPMVNKRVISSREGGRKNGEKTYFIRRYDS